MMKKKSTLTPKQARFVDEYLIDLNATQAAIRAGYRAKNADCIGPELLGKTWVADAIQKRRDKLTQKAEVTQERVIKEYAKLAFLDPTLFFDDNGNLLPITKMPKEVAAALAGFEIAGSTNEETVKKIKFVDKKGALDSLARYLGLFEKDNDQSRGVLVLSSDPIKKPKDSGIA